MPSNVADGFISTDELPSNAADGSTGTVELPPILSSDETGSTVGVEPHLDDNDIIVDSTINRNTATSTVEIPSNDLNVITDKTGSTIDVESPLDDDDDSTTKLMNPQVL